MSETPEARWVVELPIEAPDIGAARRHAARIAEGAGVDAQHLVVSRVGDTAELRKMAEVLETVPARLALARRDLGTVFRLLQQVREPRLSQRWIASRTGLAQSEISEVLGGRQIRTYDTLDRVRAGLWVPRGRMGMAYDQETEDLLAVSGEPADDPDR